MAVLKESPSMTNHQATSYFEKMKKVKTVDMRMQSGRTLDFNVDGTKLVCGALDRRVSTASIDSSGRVKFGWVSSAHEGIEQVACSTQDPNIFASASVEKSVCLWDMKQSKAYAKLSSKGSVYYVQWSPCGKYVVYGGKEDKLYSVDIRTNEVLKSYDVRDKLNQFVFHPTSNHILATTGQGKVEIVGFNGGTFESAKSIQAHASQVDCTSIDVSRDGRRMAVGGSDAACSLWDLDELICTKVISRPSTSIRSVGFSGNGQFIACGSEDPSIDIASSEDGKRLHDLKISGETAWLKWHPSQLLLAYVAPSGHNKREVNVNFFGYHHS